MIFANILISFSFLSWTHSEQEARDKNNKECKGTAGVRPTHQIHKKAQQDVGLFYAKNIYM